jgi:ATP-dependent RNA helicase DeaD
MSNQKEQDMTTGNVTSHEAADPAAANASQPEVDGSEKKRLESEQTAQDDIELIKDLLDPRILRAVQEMGFTKMTPIQERSIPLLLEGRDIIGQAQTGTGKTAAFGIPMIQKIDPELRKLQAIVLCPTRELAIQAAEEIRKLARYMSGLKVLPVYGGQDISRQIVGLKGTQIVVGTPGRVMDHMRRHTLKLDDIHMVVLDEADEMLNMGFLEDMELILGEITSEHQTALFSATMPKPILNITGKFQNNAQLIKVTPEELTVPLISQRFYRIKNKDKDAACIRLLEYYQPKLCLIFCNTKMKVDELAEILKKAGFQAEALHGDMSQHMRDAAMKRFRNGVTNILIATDVAARGIDVDDVEAVINYDIPQDIEYYVHRIGRTGRAGRTGRSFTFVSGREIYRVRDIERFCRTTIEEKRVPGAAKVMRAKAEKLLDQIWELKDSPDLELMKKYLVRKMEAEECEAIDIAAMLLKNYVGEIGEEIEADDYSTAKRFGRSGQDSRGGSRGGFGGRGGRDSRDGRGGFGGRGGYGSRDSHSSREGGSSRDTRGSYGSREGSSGRNSYVARGGYGSRDGGQGRDSYVARGAYGSRDGASGRDSYGARGGYGSRDGGQGKSSYGSRDGKEAGRSYNNKEDKDTGRSNGGRDGLPFPFKRK